MMKSHSADSSISSGVQHPSQSQEIKNQLIQQSFHHSIKQQPTPAKPLSRGQLEAMGDKQAMRTGESCR